MTKILICYAAFSGHLIRLVFFFTVALQPNLSLDRLIVKVSISRTIKHTHPVGLLCKSDQLFAEAATCTTPNTETKLHALSEIRTHDPSKQAAADVRLRPHGSGMSRVSHPNK